MVFNPARGHERQEVTDSQGQRWLRDGNVAVPYEQAEAVGFNFDDPSLQQYQVPWVRLATRIRNENVSTWNDQQWNPEAQAAGFSDWRAARAAAMNAARAQGITDDNELFYILRAGPRVWTEMGLLGGQGQPAGAPGPGGQAPPPPGSTNRPPPGPGGNPPPGAQPPPPTPDSTLRPAMRTINGVTYRQNPD